MGPPKRPYSYEIGFITGGNASRLAITESEFSDYLDAKKKLLSLLAIEEAFDIVLTSFEEFEHLLVRVALEHAMYQGIDWHSFITNLRRFNHKLNDVLSAIYLYFEHTRGALTDLFGKSSPELLLYRGFCKRECEQNLSVRLMQLIRDVSQHVNLPLKSLSMPMKRKGEPGNSILEFVSQPRFRKDDLGIKEKIPRKHREDWEKDSPGLPDDIAIPDHLRKYVMSVGRTNSEVRKITSEMAEACVSKLRNPKTAYLKSLGETELKSNQALGILELENDPTSAPIEIHPIVDSIAEHWERLTLKNARLPDLSKIVVSNRPADFQ